VLASRAEDAEQLLLLEHPVHGLSLENLRVQLTNEDLVQRKVESDAKDKAAAATHGADGLGTDADEAEGSKPAAEAAEKWRKGASASDGDNGQGSKAEQAVSAAQQPNSAKPDGAGEGNATARAIIATSGPASGEAPSGAQPTYSAVLAGGRSAEEATTAGCDTAALVSIDESARQTPKTDSTGANGDATDAVAPNPSDAVQQMMDAETTAADPPERDVPSSEVVACVTIEGKSLFYAVADVDDYPGRYRADAKALCLDAVNCQLPPMDNMDAATIQALKNAFPAQLLHAAFDGAHQFKIMARKCEAGQKRVMSCSERSAGEIQREIGVRENHKEMYGKGIRV
jgi:hypothetical protein